MCVCVCVELPGALFFPLCHKNPHFLSFFFSFTLTPLFFSFYLYWVAVSPFSVLFFFPFRQTFVRSSICMQWDAVWRITPRPDNLSLSPYGSAAAEHFIHRDKKKVRKITCREGYSARMPYQIFFSTRKKSLESWSRLVLLFLSLLSFFFSWWNKIKYKLQWTFAIRNLAIRKFVWDPAFLRKVPVKIFNTRVQVW